MARSASNKLLHQAKNSKSDEFYTRYEDIEREMLFYGAHFAGKTVYCNCDDPAVSNFFKYFYNNFEALKLKRLICSKYSPQGDTLFDIKETKPGQMWIVENGSQGLYLKSLDLKGDGDFRSAECQDILKQSDIVVTNPPFSLFRDFVAEIIRFDKKFLIIGNINALTYKEIFGLIQRNAVWPGIHWGRGISGFIVPDHYELYGTEARIDENGQRVISPNNCLWLTNLDTGRCNSFIELKKTYHGNESNYPIYDNYDGINVNRTQDIPCDYDGAIGVPITFLHKYNPLQFEIIKFRKGDDGKDLSVNGKCPYFRILIKNRLPRKAGDISELSVV